MFLIKLLALPLIIAVTLIQWVAIFLTSFSAILFDLLAGIIFMITLAGLMFGVCTGMEALKMLAVSFAIFIIPQIAEWLIERIADPTISYRSQSDRYSYGNYLPLLFLSTSRRTIL